MGLADKTCIPCRGGTPPLSSEEVQDFLKKINLDWQVNQSGHLIRQFTVGDFKGAMLIAQSVAAVADEQNHHPDLHISWGKCLVELWTHKINGLSEADFVMAAKIDRLIEV